MSGLTRVAACFVVVSFGIAACVGDGTTIITDAGKDSGVSESGGEGGPKVCAPGQQISCACPGSTTTGAQTCNGDGTGYGTCAGCPSSGDGGGDSSPDACSPKNCTQQGFTCGTQSDTCGGTISCGPCTPPQTCTNGTCM